MEVGNWSLTVKYSMVVETEKEKQRGPYDKDKTEQWR